MGSEVPNSTGDEPGTTGVVSGQPVTGPCEVIQASTSVLYGSDGKGIARFMDQTKQNNGNAFGFILSAFPTVLVGD